MIRAFRTLFSFLIIILSLACTKHRTPVLSESASENIFAIAELKKAVFEVEFQELATKEQSLKGSLHPGGDLLYKMNILSGPESLSPLLKNFLFPAVKGQKAKVKFQLNSKELYATLYDIKIPESSSPPQYLKLLPQENQKTGEFSIFKFNIQSYGTLVRSKTSTGEETHILRLKATSFDSSTHIQMDPSLSSRKSIGLANSSDSKLFSYKELHGKILTLEQLQGHPYWISMADDRWISGQKETYFQMIVDSFKKKILIYQVLAGDQKTLNALPSNFKRLLKNKSSEVKSCGPAVKKSLSKKLSISGRCYLYLNKEVSISYFNVEPRYDEENHTELGSYSLKPSAQLASSSVIQLNPSSEDPIHFEVNSTSVNLIKVKDYAGKTFMFQRTLQESPDNFPYAFTGLYGPLELVQFDFETTPDINSETLGTEDEGHLFIRRIRSLSNSIRDTPLDQETLFHFKVKYIKKYKQVKSQNTLWKKASSNDPEAFAHISWDANQVADKGSPLDLIKKICFSGARNYKLFENSTVNTNQHGKTKLNFSMQFTRTLTNLACLGPGMYKITGFNNHIQQDYNFRERFSFQEYDSRNSKNTISSIPSSVQKKFGLAFFTQNKITPDADNFSAELKHSKAQGILHDFKNGKYLTYILTGLPKKTSLRNKLIKKTIEVIKEWNIALEKAFKHTPLDRSKRKADYVYLKIDKNNLQKPFYGDLDKNYIYYESKKFATSVVGIALMGVNPLSGLIERSNTVIYGGNIESAIGHYRNLARSHKNYSDNINPKKRFKKEIKDKLRPIHQMNVYELLDSQVLENKKATSQPDLSSDLEQELGTIERNSFIKPEIESISAALSTDYFQKSELFTFTFKELQKSKDYSFDNINQTLLKELSLYYKKIDGPKDISLEIEKFAEAQEMENKIFKAYDNNQQIIIDRLDQELSGFHKKALELSSEDFLSELYSVTLSHEMGHLLGLQHNFHGSFDKEHWLFADEEEALLSQKMKKIQSNPILKSKFKNNLEKQKVFSCKGVLANFKVTDIKKNDDKIELPREFSSVMDYMALPTISPGPWDVATLRLAYTGFLEVNSIWDNKPRRNYGLADSQRNCTDAAERYFEAKPKGTAPDLKLTHNNLIHINNYMSAYGLEKAKNKKVTHDDWKSLRNHFDSKSITKKYLYCDNSDEYLYSTCNMHDEGTTPLEITQHYIKKYLASYEYTNLPSNYRGLSWKRSYKYILNRFFTFYKIRQFLDESYYKVNKQSYKKSGIQINGPEDSADNFSGAITLGRDFFHSIVRTPEPSAYLPSKNRFNLYTHRTQSFVQDLVYETKWLEDRVSGTNGELHYRGIEVDKALAIMFLTMRGVGNIAEYEKNRTWVSYADYEKMAAGDQKNNSDYSHAELITNLPTIKLVKDLLTDNVSPALFHLNSGLIEIKNSPHVKVGVNMLTQQMAIVGAAYSFQTGALDISDNFARQFYIGNTINEASLPNVYNITALGEDPDNLTSDRYWTTDYAHAAKQIIETANYSKKLIDDPINKSDKDHLTELLSYIYRSRVHLAHSNDLTEVKQKEIKASIDKNTSTLRSHIERLSRQHPGWKNISTENLIAYMADIVERSQKLFKIERLYLHKSISMDEYLDLLIREKNFNQNMVHSQYFFGIAQAALLRCGPTCLQIPREAKTRIKYIVDNSSIEKRFMRTFLNIKFIYQINDLIRRGQ